MTTDPFTDAARAEAERRWPRLPRQSGNTLGFGKRVGFVVGAEWARTRLAAQEPTDAEVLAAKAEAWDECAGMAAHHGAFDGGRARWLSSINPHQEEGAGHDD